jgi:transposase-like protein
MYLHANAKLGLAGRLALVRAVEGGLSLKAAAAAFAVSPATAHRWWHRWLEGSEEARRTLSAHIAHRGGSRPRSGRLRVSAQDLLGTAACCGCDRLCALDRLEGAEAGRDLAAATSGPSSSRSDRLRTSRMGLRPHLLHTSTPQPGAAKLAPALQHHQTTQLNRRPATDQPRSQRPWVGQLQGDDRGATPGEERPSGTAFFEGSRTTCSASTRSGSGPGGVV